MATGDSDYGGAALIGGANLLSGLISTAGQIYANSSNKKYQQALNSLMVDLSNTAHQREVLDLQAAGLNPILSASSSGASVPSLTAPDFANPGEGLSAGISSAAKASMDYKRQSAMTNSQIAVNSAQAQNLIAQNDNLREQNKEIQARIQNTNADTELKKVQAFTNKYQSTLNSWVPGFIDFTDSAGKYLRSAGNSVLSDVRDFGSSAASYGRSAWNYLKDVFVKPRAGASVAPVRDYKPSERVYTDEKGNVVKPRRVKRPSRTFF